MLRPLALAAATVLALVAIPASATAATITPTIFTDEFAPSGGEDTGCSLREAVEIANDDSTAGNETSCTIDGGIGDDTIQLGAGTYTVEIDGLDEVNQEGDLDVATSPGGDLTIDGAGAASTTIDGGPALDDRILQQTTVGALLVSDLTISRGNRAEAPDVFGAGIASAGTLEVVRSRLTANIATSTGGAIGAGGDVTIDESTIDSNVASGNNAAGAAIFTNGGATEVRSSVIADNTATGPSNVAGGGISHIGPAPITIEGSLVADNHAIDTDAAGFVLTGGLGTIGASTAIRRTTFTGNDVAGGDTRQAAAIRVVGAGSVMNLVNSTVSGNEATGAGTIRGAVQADTPVTSRVINSTFGPNPVPASATSSGLFFGDGLPKVRGSIFAAVPNVVTCAGGVASEGHNVDENGTCSAPPAAGDEVADPQLGPLQDNGGPDAGAPGFKLPVPTHAPDPASTAIDHVPAVPSSSCIDEGLIDVLLSDQRGLPRPQDGPDADAVAQCDAGALELQPPPPPPPAAQVDQPATADDSRCAALRKKLKKAKTKKKKRKIRRKLRRLGC